MSQIISFSGLIGSEFINFWQSVMWRGWWAVGFLALYLCTLLKFYFKTNHVIQSGGKGEGKR